MAFICRTSSGEVIGNSFSGKKDKLNDNVSITADDEEKYKTEVEGLIKDHTNKVVFYIAVMVFMIISLIFLGLLLKNTRSYLLAGILFMGAGFLAFMMQKENRELSSSLEGTRLSDGHLCTYVGLIESVESQRLYKIKTEEYSKNKNLVKDESKSEAPEQKKETKDKKNKEDKGKTAKVINRFPLMNSLSSSISGDKSEQRKYYLVIDDESFRYKFQLNKSDFDRLDRENTFTEGQDIYLVNAGLYTICPMQFNVEHFATTEVVYVEDYEEESTEESIDDEL